MGLNYYGNNNAYFRAPFVELNSTLRIPITEETSLQIADHNITNVINRAKLIVDNNFAAIPLADCLLQPQQIDGSGPNQVIVTPTQRL